MGTKIRKIGNGLPYHVRFKKTQVYKRLFGQEEKLIDEYYREKGEFYFSEVIYRVPASRGPQTWFNFNKVERLEGLGVIDYHKNIFMDDFKYNQQGDIEYVASRASDGQPVNLTIQKNRYGYMADIMITYRDWYFRVHFGRTNRWHF